MELTDVPCPAAGHGQILIQTRASLISAGTERMLVEFSQGNLLQKARSQPEKVKQVLDKMKTDGVLPTVEAVFRKLDEPLPLGYCNAGVVVEAGGVRTHLRGVPEREMSAEAEETTPRRCVGTGTGTGTGTVRAYLPPPSDSGVTSRDAPASDLQPGDRVVSHGPRGDGLCARQRRRRTLIPLRSIQADKMCA